MTGNLNPTPVKPGHRRTGFASQSTLKFHMTSILNELSANKSTEAVGIALRRGLTSLEELERVNA